MDCVGYSRFFIYKILLAVKLLSVICMMAAAYEPTKLSIQDDTAHNIITQGTNKFAISLYRALASKQTGNVFVSPLSVQIVLALAYTGARGQTAKELATAIDLPGNIEDTYAGYKSLLMGLQNPTLKIANGLFVERDASIKVDFQNNAKQFFLSLVENLDFKTATEKSREKINIWVENQTNNTITNLLQPGSIKNDTKVVSVNAIYFLDNWLFRFPKEYTKKEEFRVSKTRTVPIQMMHTEASYYYLYDEELEAQILQLDYKDKTTRMIIILPGNTEGLVKVESKLGRINLFQKLRYLQPEDVIVAIPKFKMEETMVLSDILKSLGVKTMFDLKKADFSGISDDQINISEVVQKAFIEVNEKGTKAAASTTSVTHHHISPMPPIPKIEFIANHPFLFILTTNDTSLFIGRVVEP